MKDFTNEESLTPSERARIRGSLRAFMMEHTARVPAFVRVLDRAAAAAMLVARAAPRMRIAAAGMMLFAVVGAGTSYAAQSALPGDVLYPIKVDLNERVASTLASSPSAHAEVDAQIVSTRLAEAETLAAQNKLSQAASAEIAANLNQTSRDFTAHVSQLATSSEDGAIEAADAQSALEATLAAHASVLQAITSAVPDATSTIAPIVQIVDERAAAMHRNRLALEDQLAASSSAPEATAASRQDAEDAIAQVEALASSTNSDDGSSTAASLSERASSMRATLESGQVSAHEGRWNDAMNAYYGAIGAAAQTQADLNAQDTLQRLLPNIEATSSTSAAASSTAAATIATSTAEQH